MNSRSSYIPRLYGRRQDKPLKPRQAALMDTLLPSLRVDVPSEGTLDPVAMFSGQSEIWLEIGFGGGEHMAWQAANNRDVGIIGAEPFINGVAKLLVHVDDEGLDNVRIHHGDARPLMERLPAGSLSRLFVLHPDPWPKARHHKRRVINRWFFNDASRLLRPGGMLRVASDIPDYITWTLMHARGEPALRWTASDMADWTTRANDWPQTRYEAKALREGRVATYLTFERI
ncbi:MAG: tRNA (guanosine(46)-N7)-methyltransferase TrmB [Pseudomonadota bacterium]